MEPVPRSGEMGRGGPAGCGRPSGTRWGNKRRISNRGRWSVTVKVSGLQFACGALTGEWRMIGGFMEMYPSNSTFHGVDVIFLLVVMMQWSKFSRFLEIIFAFPSQDSNICHHSIWRHKPHGHRYLAFVPGNQSPFLKSVKTIRSANKWECRVVIPCTSFTDQTAVNNRKSRVLWAKLLLPCKKTKGH